MRRALFLAAIGAVLGHLPAAVLAAGSEDTIALVGHKAPLIIFVAFVIIVGVAVYFMRSRDQRAAPLARVFAAGRTIHSAGPDTTVAECARKMAAAKIGALVVMDNERLVGIFTERDALNRVLAAGRDPGSTKVSEVMTEDPICIGPTTTIGEAMELVTQQRFRHLPVVEDGKVLSVVSSGDLTHWLVKDQISEAQTLADAAARS